MPKMSPQSVVPYNANLKPVAVAMAWERYSVPVSEDDVVTCEAADDAEGDSLGNVGVVRRKLV